jgi:uncharacterized delta-60 repeat protein
MKANFTVTRYWLIYLILLLPFSLFAQDGSPDLSFGNRGKVFLEFARESRAHNVIQQKDGKLLLLGSNWALPYELYMARLNPDGSLDSTFGTGGRVHFGDVGILMGGHRMALRSDGKIVIVVSGILGDRRQIAVIKLNPDGSIDSSANSGKIYLQPSLFTNYGLSLAIQPDDKLLIGGMAGNEAVVIRLTADNGTDPTFLNGDTWRYPLKEGGAVRAIRLQKDGKIVLGIATPSLFNGDYTIVRLNSNGTMDNSFNQTGIQTMDFEGHDVLGDLAIQEDCKIVVGGETFRGTRGFFALGRLNPDGIPDQTFGTSGKLLQEDDLNVQGYSLNIQKDGKILLAGSSQPGATDLDFIVARFHNDGHPDNSFGNKGFITYDFGLGGVDQAVESIIQTDGKIVAVGVAQALGANNQPNIGFGIVRLDNTVGPTPPYTCNYTTQTGLGHTLVGNAKRISLSPACFELTTDQLGQTGALWGMKIPSFFTLSGTYTIAADIYFGKQDNGADGIAFVLQPAGGTVLGERGGGLGYMGISPSFVVEFDTYHNEEPWFDVGDPVEDHIGFMKNGSPYHKGPQSGALMPPIPLPVNIEDDQYHHVEFHWNHVEKTMTVSFLGKQYTYTGNIVDSLFGGNPNVFFGFTAATGSPLFNVSQNVQRVCNIEVITYPSTNTVARQDNGLVAQPNPTTGNLFLRLEENLKGTGRLTVLNATGSVVKQQQIVLYGKDQLIPLDISHCPRGVYLIQIIAENGKVTQKVVRY